RCSGKRQMKHSMKQWIGNYRHADTKLSILDTQETARSPRPRKQIIPIVPTDCEIHLETAVINLLEELRKKRSSRKERMLHNNYQVKTFLGRRPTYKE